MKALTTSVPRYLFAAVFIVFGLFHFMGGANMAGMVPIPGGVFWVYLTGLAHIAAGVSFILKRYDYWAGLLLAAMLVIFVLAVHLPGVINAADEAAMQGSTTNLLKDLGLAAGSLMMAHIASERS